MTHEIKVGLLASYDWEYLRISLPLVYSHADKICVSIDRNRKTWSGNQFTIDEQAFYEFIKEIDLESKIDVYEDDFFIDTKNPMNNEVYQRNQMGKRLLSGGWHIQIDADEYIPDFKSFVEKLTKLTVRQKISINVPIVNIFKKITDGFLLIKGKAEYVSIATNAPTYKYGRKSGYRNLYFNHNLLHQSYARNPEEIKQKLNNWGHKNDFDGQKFFDFWNNLSEDNFRLTSNFHPIAPETWSHLEKVKSSSIDDLIVKNAKTKTTFKQRIELLCLNSKIISKFVQVTGIKPWMFR